LDAEALDYDVCTLPGKEVKEPMMRFMSTLIAGLVVLAFAGEGLAQAPAPTTPPASSPGPSAEKPAAKPAKKKGKPKHSQKRDQKARAPEMSTKKTQ